jgi:MFS transporter, ENTS family, enterobactin (siderophore) exporter
VVDQPLTRNRDFVTLLGSQSVSVLGDSVSATALPLLVYALTGSGLVMGAILAINTGADFVLGTVAGAMADRGDRKRMMLLADAGRAGFTALIPITALLHGPTLAIVVLTSAPLAVLRGFFRAGYLAAMPNLVGRSQLARGNGILEVAYSTTFILGPVIAGFLVSVIGAAETLAIDAASFAISAVGLLLIRRDLKAPADRPPSPMLADIREGIVYVVRNPALRSVILLFALSSAVLTPIGAAMTFRIVRDLGLSPAAFGLTLTGFGVGAVVGAAVVSRLGPNTNVARFLIGTLVVTGLPLILTGFADSLPVIVVLAAISGVGETSLAVVYIATRAANSPDELVGRIASTARAMALGLMPVGGLVGGVLIDTIGGGGTLVALGASLLALGLVFSQIRSLRSTSFAPRHPVTPPTSVALDTERELQL